MTVRDLLQMEVDVDVYDDFDERLGIAFVGSQELTPEGEAYYEHALELPVRFASGDVAIVECDNWRDANIASDLFTSIAGFCSTTKWNRYFKEASNE